MTDISEEPRRETPGEAASLALQAREGLAGAGHLADQHEVEVWLRQRGRTW